MPNTVVEKSRRRLLILTISTVLISVCGGVLFAVHQWQSVRQYQRMRNLAQQAMDKGDYAQAVEALWRCLAYWPDDPQLLDAFARAQVHVGDQAQRYMDLTIDVLNRSLNANPHQDQAARLLADMYIDSGDEMQAIELADRVLKQQPDNLSLLKRRGLALARQGQFEAAVADVDRCISLAPQDHELYLLRLYLMQQQHLPRQQFLAAVEGWQPRLHDPAWTHALMGVACRLIGLDSQALTWFDQSAAKTGDDPVLAMLLIRQLEAMGRFVQANNLLSLTDPQHNKQLRYLKAWRHWQNREDAPLIAMSADNIPEVLALQILACKRMGQPDRMSTLRKALAQSTSTTHARLCERLLTLMLQDKPAAAGKLIKTASALRSESVLADLADLVLAQQWDRLGEQDNALAAWRRLANSSPAWHLPHLQQARLLLGMGHSLAAAASARQCLDDDPSDLQAGVLLAEALSHAGGDARLNVARSLVEQLKPRLPIDTAVVLEARVLDQKATLQMVRQIIEKQTKLQPQTWLELARISLQRDAHWHDLCLNQYRLQSGVSPRWLALMVRALDAQHRIAAARQRLNTMVNQQVNSHRQQTVDWLMVQAHFLASIDDHLSAQVAYRYLLEHYPQHIDVARAILAEPMTLQLADLRQDAVDQLHRLTGDYAVGWRYEQARLNLARSSSNRSLAQSARLLHEALKLTPAAVDCRLLLITCLEKIGSEQGMQEQARAILQVDPYDSTALELLRQASRDQVK